MSNNAKKFLFAIVILLIVVMIVFVVTSRYNKSPFSQSQEGKEVLLDEIGFLDSEDDPNDFENLIDSFRLIGSLPTSGERTGLGNAGKYNGGSVEYISFLDFYNKTEESAPSNTASFELPLNIKTDVINYYDISRKINLDDQVDFLNDNAFAVINNPFSDNNFYNIYNSLYMEDVPILITSDFLIYYYQYVLKKAFKDIEENIFYDNLWDINYFLYEKAKNRYEENLRKIGGINDRVLEAQRLAAAYFATSLELLKPVAKQISSSNDLSNNSLFSPFEAEHYSFVLPEYLRVDVGREINLIRTAKSSAKSPVLLYDRNYNEFVVPQEYKSHAKLNNFYLSSIWLSSSFPLFYRDNDCPGCYLDFDDWRVNLITSSFIAGDIFDNYEFKIKWARIYKTLAFFKGLRGDLTYVHYRDALVNVFGENYKIEEIFGDNNSSAVPNLYRFRDRILEYKFLDIEGGIDRGNPDDKRKIGVKMLADFYWPNDYIFNRLSYPYVLSYDGLSIEKNNVTSCSLKNEINNVRCNGFSLDIVALLDNKNLSKSNIYLENTNYKNYREALHYLKSQIEKFPSIWHYNNYWKALNIAKEYLSEDKDSRPVFARGPLWYERELSFVVGSWINLQIPIDRLSPYQKYKSRSTIMSDKTIVDYNYIEPNLNLVNEQIANINMILEMFRLLKITDELRSVLISLEDLKNNLTRVRAIIIKELSSDSLSNDDLLFVSSLGLELKLDQNSSKVLKIESPNKKAINYDISSSKLLILVSETDGRKSFSVGPIFSYKELR